MQVHRTPVLINGDSETMTVTVGAGGPGVYYGPNYVNLESQSTAAPGSTFTVTSPTYVKTQGGRDESSDISVSTSGSPSSADTSALSAKIAAARVEPMTLHAPGIDPGSAGTVITPSDGWYNAMPHGVQLPDGRWTIHYRGLAPTHQVANPAVANVDGVMMALYNDDPVADLTAWYGGEMLLDMRLTADYRKSSLSVIDMPALGIKRVFNAVGLTYTAMANRHALMTRDYDRPSGKALGPWSALQSPGGVPTTTYSISTNPIRDISTAQDGTKLYWPIVYVKAGRANSINAGMVSTDYGVTWTFKADIIDQAGDTGNAFDEPWVEYDPATGEILCLVRDDTASGTNGNRFVLVSTDDGATWTSRLAAGAAPPSFGHVDGGTCTQRDTDTGRIWVTSGLSSSQRNALFGYTDDNFHSFSGWTMADNRYKPGGSEARKYIEGVILKLRPGLHMMVYGSEYGPTDLTAPAETIIKYVRTRAPESPAAGQVLKFRDDANLTVNLSATDDALYQNTGAGTVHTVNLPKTRDAAGNELLPVGKTFTIIRDGTGTYTQNITPATGDTIQGKTGALAVVARGAETVLRYMGLGRWIIGDDGGRRLNASKTWDPPSVALGATTTTTVTVTGALVGDYVRVAGGVSLAGMILAAQVTAADTVTLTLFNPSGNTGAVDLASATYKVEVIHS